MRRPFVCALALSLVSFASVGFAAQGDEDEEIASESEPADETATEDAPAADSEEEEAGGDEKKKEKDDDDDGDDDDGAGGDGPYLSKAGEDISGESRVKDHMLGFMTLGVGFQGQAGAAILDKPDDQTVQGMELSPEYPGFAGLHTAIGPVFELRFLGYVGIELGVLIGSDEGQAELSVTNFSTNTTNKFDIEISNSAIHMPLLIKGALPGEIVTPHILFGPEFVFVSDPKFDVVSGTNNSGKVYTAFGEDYTQFTFGLGIEFNLPIPYVDARIPFSLRGSVNPGVGEEREDRAKHTLNAQGNDLTGVDFKTEWRFQPVANLGLMFHI